MQSGSTTHDLDTKITSQWVADLKLNKKETDPLLLVISQPLLYKTPNNKPTLEPQEPITGKALDAIVAAIPKNISVTIVLGDGQNRHRYLLIDPLLFQKDSSEAESKTTVEMQAESSKAEIKISAEMQAATDKSTLDGKKWYASNEESFKKWEKEGRQVSVHLASTLMADPECGELFKTMLADHQKESLQGEPKSLQETFNTLAKAAITTLYPQLMGLTDTGFSMYVRGEEKLLDGGAIKQRIVNSNLNYIIHEFALTVILARKTNAKYILYKGYDKEGKETTKKKKTAGGSNNKNHSKQINFGEFAPRLVRLAVRIYGGEPQLPLSYKEYSLAQQEISSPNKKSLEDLIDIAAFVNEIVTKENPVAGIQMHLGLYFLTINQRLSEKIYHTLFDKFLGECTLEEKNSKKESENEFQQQYEELFNLMTNLVVFYYTHFPKIPVAILGRVMRKTPPSFNPHLLINLFATAQQNFESQPMLISMFPGSFVAQMPRQPGRTFVVPQKTFKR